VRIRQLAALGLAGTLLLAACGSDDDDDDASGGGGGGGDHPTYAAPDENIEATLRVWVNGPDTPQSMRDFAEQTFEEQYPNVDVVFEEQEWDGIVARLTSSLASEDSPDIVEMGNTQTPIFASSGALLDLTSVTEDLGGDDLTDALVDSGTYDDSLYATPLYGAARIVIYRKDLFEQAGLEIPTTMEDFIAAGETLQEENADTPNFSGIYFPGRNWHGMLSFLWDNGGDIAVQEDGEWVGQLTSDESIEALETVQQVMENANQAPADGDDAEDYIEFCAGEIGMMATAAWKLGGGVLAEEGGCPAEMEGKVGAFALPGSGGESAPVFLGGSNLGVSANSQNPELAVEFMKLITSPEFQEQYAEAGLFPGRESLYDLVTGEGVAGEAVDAQAAAIVNARAVPASEFWGEVEEQNVLQDMGTAIASGEDVGDAAEEANTRIEEILNQ
jgi:N,N'-diacetylchitobiose transport system substrate-binding protein